MNKVVYQHEAQVFDILKIALFLSGAAALMFETLWIRNFTIIYGSTTEAASATFAAFLLGLAFGAYYAGSIASKLKNPLIVYVLLEVTIGLVALVLGFILHFSPEFFTVANSSVYQRVINSFCLTLLIIFVPTFLMGMTFPVIIEQIKRVSRRNIEIAGLYAANLYGSGTGILIVAFFALPSMGVINSYILAMVFNILAAGICIINYKLINASKSNINQSNNQTTVATNDRLKIDYVLIAMLSGAVVLSAEVVWFRFAGFFLGNRVFAYSLILFIVLFALGKGADLARYLYNKYSDKDKNFILILLVLSAVVIPLNSYLTWTWVVRLEQIEALLHLNASYMVSFKIISSIILVAPMIVLLGTLFPYVLLMATSMAANPASSSGRLYLYNSLGSVFGCLFIGMYGLDIYKTSEIISFLSCLPALLLLCILISNNLLKKQFILALSSLGLILMLNVSLVPRNLLLLKDGEKLAYIKEDRYGAFQIAEKSNGTKRVTLNNTDLVYYVGNRATDYVQQMQAHLGMWFNTSAKNIAVLGSGYGITAGAFGLYDTPDNIDAVEIIPEMVKTADYYEPYNNSYHINPKIKIYIDDGRHFIEKSNKSYDIISVNVSDPLLPGGSALFNKEFYQSAAEKLSSDGVLIQHVFGISKETIFSTLLNVFPYLAIFPSYSNGYNVVAAKHELSINWQKVENISNSAVNKELQRIGFIEPFRPNMLSWLTQDDLPYSMAHADISTDNYPRLEFDTRSVEHFFHSNQ